MSFRKISQTKQTFQTVDVTQMQCCFTGNHVCFGFIPEGNIVIQCCSCLPDRRQNDTLGLRITDSTSMSVLWSLNTATVILGPDASARSLCDLLSHANLIVVSLCLITACASYLHACYRCSTVHPEDEQTPQHTIDTQKERK